MGAPLSLRWFADAIENTKRRFHHLPGAHHEQHGLAKGAQASAGEKPRWAIARIWHQLKGRAGRPSDQEVPAAPAAATKQPALAVQVVFMGDLPSIIGQRGLQVALPQEATVGDLFEFLSRTYGEIFTSRVFRSRAKLHPTMLVLVDGENINGLGGLAAKLGNSEVEVIMLPIIEGG